MSSQWASAAVMRAKESASAARKLTIVWSEKTTPQPKVSSRRLRSRTVMSASGRAFLSSRATYSPAGPPPTTATFTARPS